MSELKITKLARLEGHRLAIHFSNGAIVLNNFEYLSPLNSRAYFKSVRIGKAGQSIRWPSGPVVSLKDLYVPKSPSRFEPMNSGVGIAF